MNTIARILSYTHVARLEIERRYFASINAVESHAAADAIHSALVELGVSFEGRRLPVSLRPTILSASEIDYAAWDLGGIRQLLNRVLELAVADLRAGQENTPILNFFDFYRPWFQIISQEVRSHDHIMLMRYDAVRDSAGDFRVMEPNAACPGGVIHCAYIREAWSKTTLGQALLRDTRIIDRECDSPDGLIRLLYNISPRTSAPRIALCNYKGFFNNELSSLVRRNDLLRAQGLVDGELVICDIREISVVDGRAMVGGRQIDVIYNKINQLMVNPSDPEISGWIKASELESCEFLNSLAALYLGEAKSIFAALHDDEICASIGATPEEIEIINRRIPRTRMMIGRSSSPRYSELAEDRHRLVVKADALTRGAGVHVGKLETSDSWGSALLNLARSNAIIQDVLDVPQREAVLFNSDEADAIGNLYTEYWGVDFFFYGEMFAGVVGRAHSSMIFNVGNGGMEVPTFVID